jgi:hypothetical protein
MIRQDRVEQPSSSRNCKGDVRIKGWPKILDYPDDSPGSGSLSAPFQNPFQSSSGTGPDERGVAGTLIDGENEWGPVFLGPGFVPRIHLALGS